MTFKILWNKPLFVLALILAYSTIGLGQACFPFYFEKLVNSSDLIVIGELRHVSETVIGEGKISKGTLVIEQVIYGNFVSSNGQNLKPNDKVQIEWMSVSDQNKRLIWFLDVDVDGTIKPSLSRALLEELEAVRRILKAKKANNLPKKIELKKDSSKLTQLKSNTEREPLECLYAAKESKPKKYSTFSAFLAIIASISLYYFLYRSPFRIR